MSGLIGRKLGMTQIFSDAGAAVPVTVIEAGPCPVLQVKTADAHGYAAVQLGFGAQTAKKVSRAELGHAKKAGLEAAPDALREFKVPSDQTYEVGQQLTKPALGLVEVPIVPEPAEQTRLQARLAGIDLPRVQVEDCRLSFKSIYASDAPTGPRVRQ